MPKITIAHNPTFNADVDIPRAGGAVDKVSFTFAYLDRDQLAEYFDRQHLHRKAVAELMASKDATVKDVTALVSQQQCEVLEQIVKAWSFDDPVCSDSICELVRTFAAAPEAVTKAFESGYNGARLGN